MDWRGADYLVGVVYRLRCVCRVKREKTVACGWTLYMTHISLTMSEEKNILERRFALKRCQLPKVQEFTCPHRVGLLSERRVGMRVAFSSPLGDISRK